MNLNANRYTLNSNSGFTLIEVLVSIFILAVALTAAVSALVFNSNNANIIKNSYIASGLAQEGVEVVRNLRDSDWLAGRVFGAFGNTANVPFADGVYRVQWDSTLLMSGLDVFLKKDSATGLYNYSTGADTLFKRTITLTTVNPGIESRIVVNVTWSERGLTKTVSAEEHLFNWR